MTRVGAMMGNVWYPGLVCYGILVGNSHYVQHMLSEKVQETKEKVVIVKAVLGKEEAKLFS